MQTNLWSELKRRQVPKTVIGYAVAVWAVLQIADVTFGPLGVPSWVQTVLVVAAILGFPLIVALAWFFDLTRSGVVRESEEVVGTPTRPRRAALVMVASLGVAAVGVAAYLLSPRLAERDDAVKTVAVFRFDNLSGDTGLDDIAAGVSDELRRRLGPVPGLRIIGRDSVQSPILAGLDNADVAQRLGATHAVRGSLRRSGRDLLVQVSLERMATGEALWSAQFERDATRLLDVQSLVSEAVGQALVRRLSEEQRAQLRKLPTTNPRAWELYQRAVRWPDEWTLQSAETAIAQLNEATRLDPKFALGYATLADAYWGRLQMAQLPFSESARLIQGAIDKALKIDPNLAEAWSNAGALRTVLLFDARSALPMHRRAVALDPNSVIAWLNYSQHLIWFGPFDDKAREAVATLRGLDPVGLFSVGQTPLLTIGEYQTVRDPKLLDETLKSLESAKKLGPRFWVYFWWECMALRYKDRADQAIPVCEQAVELAEGSLEPVPMLALAYAQAGRREDALAILRRLKREAEQRYLPPTWFAMIHASLGDRAACLDALEQADRVRDWNRSFLRDPVFDFVRDDARFQSVYRKLGMPEPVIPKEQAGEGG